MGSKSCRFQHTFHVSGSQNGGGRFPKYCHTYDGFLQSISSVIFANIVSNIRVFKVSGAQNNHKNFKKYSKVRRANDEAESRNSSHRQVVKHWPRLSQIPFSYVDLPLPKSFNKVSKLEIRQLILSGKISIRQIES